ncbi:MAG: intradiol ring-cleavage dioxygenase [Nitrososphaeraceae archaeon]
MGLKGDDKSNNFTITINIKTISLALVITLTVLIILGVCVTSIPVSAQSIPNNGNTIPSLNQSVSSLPMTTSAAFPPPPQISPELSGTQISSSTNKTCRVTPSVVESGGTPQQTEGPYFVDGMPNRSDIRSDPSDGSVQKGIPLHLVIHVYTVNSNGSCDPLKGAQVDIWHANSQGVYSSVSDQGTTGKKFLRGYQMTDDKGTVHFTTIYPGWYQGRAIHIHDKVRIFNGSEKTLDWTSQLYMNNSVNEQVHNHPPYSIHGVPELTNEQDAIYAGPSTDHLIRSNTGKHLILDLTKDGQQSYLGTFNIVLNANQ